MWKENLGISAGDHLIEVSINMGSVFYAEFGPQMKYTILRVVIVLAKIYKTPHTLKFYFLPETNLPKQPQH